MSDYEATAYLSLEKLKVSTSSRPKKGSAYELLLENTLTKKQTKLDNLC